MTNNPLPVQDRPLVTFALLAYNQEKYVQEAVEGAFSQTYEPLDIILSDDCSGDRTFQIICEMARAYDGPHRVVVRKNDCNLGILEHINEVVRESRGKVIVLAAGDDVSYASRVERVMKVFSGSRDCMAVVTMTSELSTVVENETGEIQGLSLAQMVAGGGGIGKGAAYAYRRECFFWPDQLPSALVSEDRILPLRAGVLGHVAALRAPLVFYRDSMNGLTRALVAKGTVASLDPQHRTEVRRTLKLAYSQGLISLPSYISYITIHKFITPAGQRSQKVRVPLLGSFFFRVRKKLLSSTRYLNS